ncbi:MAG: DNA repair protein RecO [Candidatus Paceibacterota bacterium]
MHSIRTTHGLVLESRPFGEAGKMISILTEDLGLVRAVAEGIRLEKSKLRYFVQEYSFGQFSLVRGKEYWRLTSANEWEKFPSRTIKGPSLEIVARSALLLKRFVHGEQAHSELFTLIVGAVTLIQSKNNWNEEELSVLESLLVYLILQSLGYIGKDPELDLQTADLNLELVKSITAKKTLINKHINKALRESQM